MTDRDKLPEVIVAPLLAEAIRDALAELDTMTFDEFAKGCPRHRTRKKKEVCFVAAVRINGDSLTPAPMSCRQHSCQLWYLRRTLRGLL